MSKFLFLYRGPATPMDEFTPEEGEKQMAAWGAWIQRAGTALADAGAPFGQRDAVADDGTAATASDQNGYSIIEAEDLASARKLTDGHPFLAEGKGRFTIDIFELVPM